MPYVSGNQNFQQGAFVKAERCRTGVKEEGQLLGRLRLLVRHPVGTRRDGVPVTGQRDQILDQTKYQYWNGSTWVANKPSAAKPILPGTTSGGFFGFFNTTTYPSVSEMSVQYNPYLKKYVMLYADQNNNVVMRTATAAGPVVGADNFGDVHADPGLYAPMIHPWSSTLKPPGGGTAISLLESVDMG